MAGSAVGAVGSLAGGLISSRGASDAANAQADAAAAAAQVQQNALDYQAEILAPQLASGQAAQAALGWFGFGGPSPQYFIDQDTKQVALFPDAAYRFKGAGTKDSELITGRGPGGGALSGAGGSGGSSNQARIDELNSEIASIRAGAERSSNVLPYRDVVSGGQYGRQGRSLSASEQARIDELQSQINGLQNGGGGSPLPIAGANGDVTEQMIRDGEAGFEFMSDAYMPGYLQYYDEVKNNFEADPGRAFAIEEAEDALMKNAAAFGQGLDSGSTYQALTDYRVGRANQDYNNYLSREMAALNETMGVLSQLSGYGNQASGQLVNAVSNSANNQSAALMAGGTAQASGIAGQANAFSDGLSGVFSALQNGVPNMFGTTSPSALSFGSGGAGGFSPGFSLGGGANMNLGFV